jgi:regulatory protein spx
MLKKVDLYLDPKDPHCQDIRSFLEEQEIDLHIHNIIKDPLSKGQLSGIIRHLDLKHFLNTESKIFKKNRLDKEIPARDEVLELLAEDNDLLRKPIIIAGRLMTVGCNRQKIIEMLQIKSNGSDPESGRDERSQEGIGRSKEAEEID